MPNRVIDTNIVLDIWHGRSPSKIKARSESTVKEAAKTWLKENPGDMIVTPVKLEILGGVNDKEELRLTDLFLSHFKLLDQGKVLQQDWREAERIARRVRGTGRKRDAIDCLILAICNRLDVEFYTQDTGVLG